MSMYDGVGANIYGNRLSGTRRPDGTPYTGYDPANNALMPLTQPMPNVGPVGVNGLPYGVVPYQQTQPMVGGGGNAAPGTLAAIAANAGQALQFPVQTRTVYAPPIIIQAPATPAPQSVPGANNIISGFWGEGGGGEGGGGGGGGDGGGGGFKDGGEVNPDRDYRRGSRIVHALSEGRVSGDGNGKADDHCAYVPRGSFIVPASVVAAVGGGNNIAGAAAIAKAMPRADDREKAEMIPVRVSAGEFVIHPAHVTAIGGGDHAAGVAKIRQLMSKHL